MNSSTFSSEHEWKVLLIVALTISVCEAGSHFLVQHFEDVQHRNQIPHLAQQLRSRPSPRVLFLGNSLTKMGIRLDSFEDHLGQHGLRVGGVCKIRPDDTTLRHWHYIFQRHFDGCDCSQSPDYVIITFVFDHLSDQVKSRFRRLAFNVQGRQQVFDVLRNDVDSLENGVYFLAAHFLESVYHQPSIKHGILKRVVPHYESETQRLNSVFRSYREAKSHGKEPNAVKADSYEHLREFIALLRKNGCHAMFCLMPLPNEQSLDPRLVNVIDSHQMTFLDLRNLASQTKGHYPDGYHMDSEAADIYSRAVAVALSKHLKGIPASQVVDISPWFIPSSLGARRAHTLAQ